MELPLVMVRKHALLLELCTGAGVPELRYILLEPEPELENSSKNSGRQNYEKLILIQIKVVVLPEFLRSVK